MTSHPSSQLMVDYLAGGLRDDEEDRLEEHVFECDDCARTVNELYAVAAGVRAATGSGKIAMAASPALLERLEQNGVRVRHYRATAGGQVACGVEAGDDYVASHLAADFGGASSVDVVAVTTDGRELRRVERVPIASDAVEVTMITRADYVRSFPSMTFYYRIFAGQLLIAEYTFSHTAYAGP
jgi:anti-sigma factor RsiW